MDMAEKLRERVSTASKQSGDGKMVPLLNPVAFAAWMCEERSAAAPFSTLDADVLQLCPDLRAT
ncbi:hypothetical protein C2W62_10305 [Candidatus Entotheonella serta]|nr:hypothetical protein C2W62_10305 [Candidatus Entotheonella serta]